MTKSEGDPVKRITAALFVCMIFAGFFAFASYKQPALWLDFFSHYRERISFIVPYTVSSMEADFSGDMPVRSALVDLNGLITKKAGMTALYNDKNIYFSEDGYIVSKRNRTDGEYEYREIMALKSYLDENGIDFLYVNLPDKYLSDEEFERCFGLETYSNRNMDAFLERLRSSGVEVLDVRQNIKEENLDIREMFYRTDHHPTTETGLWIAGLIAEKLDESCGYAIPPELFDLSLYGAKEWKRCWLGSQGKTVGRTCIEPDDYTLILPSFGTDYIFKTDEGDYPGDFSLFINDEYLTYEGNIYDAVSRHDAYFSYSCINNSVPNGKVLMLEDSYGRVIEPFLSLGIHETDSELMRAHGEDFDLKGFIKENGYDTVIVSYAQNMLGEHDDPASVNRDMFSFVDIDAGKEN